MDSETRQPVERLRERIARINESLDMTTEASGVFMEACHGRFSDMTEILEILVDEFRFSRKQIMDEINAIKRKLGNRSE